MFIYYWINCVIIQKIQQVWNHFFIIKTRPFLRVSIYSSVSKNFIDIIILLLLQHKNFKFWIEEKIINSIDFLGNFLCYWFFIVVHWIEIRRNKIGFSTWVLNASIYFYLLDTKKVLDVKIVFGEVISISIILRVIEGTFEENVGVIGRWKLWFQGI